MMTTPRTSTIVSLTAMMAVTLAAACVRAPSGSALDRPAPMDSRPVTIRFDNEAREHVHVYLVDRERQWLLGRVEPGARATLRIPRAALAGSQGFVQLAVLAGGGQTLQAARDRRATFTAAQPALAIVSQQWMFAQGQLTSLPLRGRANVGPQ